jgi:hypothetical protein
VAKGEVNKTRMTGQNDNAIPVESAPEECETKLEGSSDSDELAQLQLGKHKLESLQESRIVVHGLRNSANSILVAMEYLIEDAANVLTEEQPSLLRGAMQSALSILHTLEKFPTFQSRGTDSDEQHRS